ncbi:hypothetical protein ACFWIX_10360 [Pseudarthrobacter sp. NPDC058362]|uniref:hypothetical protein n=1 Tax=Pseudarthrobacter sp. NPDC058362 TaxID=3346458 RepID=UPI003649526E
MSHEQPPIRSRRELRKARDAQQAAAAGNTAHDDGQATAASGEPSASGPALAATPASSGRSGPDGAPPSAPAAEVSAAPRQASTERSSQVRARDRAALRAIKEMEQKENQLSAGGPVTRRQLRLQQLKEQALTGLNPVVPPAQMDAPAAAEGNGPTRPGAPGNPKPNNPAHPRAAGDGPQPGPASGHGLPAMTVEQALAARSLIAEQARNQIAKMEHIVSLDPEAVDPEILAEQIALAERAAVLNRRAMARQKLAEQASAPPARDSAAKERQAPSTATNLAMVTPLEFVQVPGVDRPVMKAPATSYVPVTTHQGTKIPARESGAAATADRTQGPNAPQGPSGQVPDGSGSKRSHVIARAEAAARAAGGAGGVLEAQPVQHRQAQRRAAQEGPATAPQSAPQETRVPAQRPLPQPPAEPLADDLFEDLPRVPAASAHGLEPLDAATAGLARANRNRMLQIFVLALGIVALIAGIILIISGFSG